MAEAQTLPNGKREESGGRRAGGGRAGRDVRGRGRGGPAGGGGASAPRWREVGGGPQWPWTLPSSRWSLEPAVFFPPQTWVPDLECENPAWAKTRCLGSRGGCKGENSGGDVGGIERKSGRPRSPGLCRVGRDRLQGQENTGALIQVRSLETDSCHTGRSDDSLSHYQPWGSERGPCPPSTFPPHLRTRPTLQKEHICL